MRVGIRCFVFLLILLSSNVALVTSASWSEVTRFTGSGYYKTDYFTCNHVEWRINWNYKPNSSYPESAVFAIYIYPRNASSYIGVISQYGNTTTNDTTYIHNRQGEFYLKFLATNLEGYSAVIEQDMESVPEFSPMILLPLLTTGILVAMVLARRQRHLRSPHDATSSLAFWLVK